MRLTGRTAVVTGAASGIGRAIAIRLAAEGASVVVSDIRTDPIWDGLNTEPTTDVIVSAGGTAIFHKADVSVTDDVHSLIQRVVQEYGRLDIMINNAGLVGSHNILETTEGEWDRLMSVNLRGQFLCCKAAITQMVTQEPVVEIRGRVINVSSQQGFIGPPDYFAYAVSKGGVVQMTRQLSTDYARHGILVNGLAPGRIITGTHPGEIDMTDPVLTYSRARTPYPRLGRADDVAGAALFLSSDDCTFISGHTLPVDGGWLAY